MANPSDADLQAEIIREVGDPNGTIGPHIVTIWSIFADRGLIDWRLQFLYTKRAVAEARLAEEQASTDIQLAKTVEDTQSQKFDHLVIIRDQAHAEIGRVEAQSRARRTGFSAALSTLAPTTPPSTDSADANDSIYLGDPYKTPFRP